MLCIARLIMASQNNTGISWGSRYPFLLLLLPFVSGIMLYHYIPAIRQPLLLGGLLLFSFLLALSLHLVKATSTAVSYGRSLFLCLMMCSLACVMANRQDIEQQPLWYAHTLSEAEAFQVVVKQAPETKPRTLYLPVAVTAYRAGQNWRPAIGQFKLYIYLNDSIRNYKAGEALLLPNKLAPIANPGNPFNFDYAAYARRNGFYHQAFLPETEVVRMGSRNVERSSLSRVSASMLGHIQDNIRDSTTRALVSAILLNERTLLDDDLWQAYAATGIVHIIAISGMHVVMLFSVLQFLLSWIRHKKWAWAKYLLALPLVWAYIAITDYPPSAIRAALAFTLVTLSVGTARRGNTLNSWAAAALLMLLYQPDWLYDVGVQLSFLAVLSILLFYLPLRNLYKPRQAFVKIIWETVAVSMAAQILVFPLVIYYFHQFPVWVLLVNIPAALYSFVLMVGALLLCLLAAIGLPCLWLGQLLVFCTQGFHHIIWFFARYTPASMRALFLDELDFWLMTGTVIIFCLWCFRRQGRLLIAALSSCCLLLVSFIIQDWQAMRQSRFVVYNAPHMSLAERYEGKQVMALYDHTDSIDRKTWQYTLLPAHLGYRSSKQAKGLSPSGNIQLIGNYSLLYLQGSYACTRPTSFPVDYLVLTNQCRFQPELWLQVFRPRKIILDGSLPRWKAIKWKSELAVYQVPVHWVQEDGAFIVSASR